MVIPSLFIWVLVTVALLIFVLQVDGVPALLLLLS